MALYKIRWKVAAGKELSKLSNNIILKIIDAVEKLSENPLPKGTRKLKGTQHTYRIRVGNYRVIYSLIHEVLVVEVIRVGYRKDIYKKFKRRK